MMMELGAMQCQIGFERRVLLSRITWSLNKIGTHFHRYFLTLFLCPSTIFGWSVLQSIECRCVMKECLF